jgi:LacI family transcriptional regulator
MEKRVRVAFVLDRTISYERDLIMGIIQYSSLFSNWDFFLQATDFWETDKKRPFINELKNWRPDCIVMNDNYFVSEFCEWGIPLFVAPCKELMPGVINIIADDKKIGALGAHYFIDKGYNTLAFYGTDKIFWSQIRKAAYKDLVLTSGLNYFEFDALMENNWHDNHLHLGEWIKRLPKPAAVMACHDEFGSHLIIAAKANGIDVPQDLAILGVDNDAFICKLYDPHMSSIDQVPKNVGYKVGQCIKSMIVDDVRPTDNIIGTDFFVVTRQSTDIFAVEDTQILKALQFIKDNTGNKLLTVDEVVSSTSLSRRVLEIRFRKLLNRSILEEIKQVRIDSICQKLRFTNIPINEIAYSMGFNSISSFSSYFKKDKKFSPLEFRKQFQTR